MYEQLQFNSLFILSYLLISTHVITQDNYLAYNQLGQALCIYNVHVINKINAILSKLTYMILPYVHIQLTLSITYRSVASTSQNTFS